PSICPAQGLWFHDHRVLGAHRKAGTGPVPAADRHRKCLHSRVLGEQIRHRDDRRPWVSVRRPDPGHIHPAAPAHPAPVRPSRIDLPARLVGTARPAVQPPERNYGPSAAAWDGWQANPLSPLNRASRPSRALHRELTVIVAVSSQTTTSSP